MWQTIISSETWQKITKDIDTLLVQRASLHARIIALEADGCLSANLVEEYRGKYGPYFRLTFPTDPATGVKPAPQYIGTDHARLEQIRRQIANYQACLHLNEQVNEINLAIQLVKADILKISRFLHHKAHPVDFVQTTFLDGNEP
jgi:hypothetical protein